MKNSEDPVKKLLNLVGQEASSNLKRNWRQGPTCTRWKTLEDSGSNTGQRRPQAGPSGPRHPPFDLAASRTIYSPLAESHERIHSSSTAEEKKSLRDTISERRVVLVV
jgi:hypothetical protein